MCGIKPACNPIESAIEKAVEAGDFTHINRNYSKFLGVVVYSNCATGQPIGLSASSYLALKAYNQFNTQDIPIISMNLDRRHEALSFTLQTAIPTAYKKPEEISGAQISTLQGHHFPDLPNCKVNQDSLETLYNQMKRKMGSSGTLLVGVMTKDRNIYTGTSAEAGILTLGGGADALDLAVKKAMLDNVNDPIQYVAILSPDNTLTLPQPQGLETLLRQVDRVKDSPHNEGPCFFRHPVQIPIYCFAKNRVLVATPKALFPFISPVHTYDQYYRGSHALPRPIPGKETPGFAKIASSGREPGY
jgi:hypothetical protein